MCEELQIPLFGIEKNKSKCHLTIFIPKLLNSYKEFSLFAWIDMNVKTLSKKYVPTKVGDVERNGAISTRLKTTVLADPHYVSPTFVPTVRSAALAKICLKH